MTEAVENHQLWTTPPILYRPDLEQPRPDEDALIEKITAKLRKNNERAYRKYKHGLRDAHAKSHAILRGELIVAEGLRPELAQGMFAQPRTYPVIARISSTSGVLRSDKMRGVRGLGVKVLGVEGPRAMADEPNTTQDFVLVTHEEFLFGGARDYLRMGMPTATVLARLPDSALAAGSELLGLLKRIGLRIPDNLAVFIAENRPILGETFFSSAPIRYGDYVARFKYAPLSTEVRDLENQRLPRNPSQDAHRDLIMDFFAKHTAEYELSVQLCTDEKTMPIEDARVHWDAKASPYLPVAKVVFGRQNPYSAVRRAYGDDVLSFNSWRGLEAHRPLGSINRLKRKVYEASSDFRHQMNRVDRHEPADISELPD
ncbi:catalase family protein [Mycolicibacterium sp. XJ870]